MTFDRWYWDTIRKMKWADVRWELAPALNISTHVEPVEPKPIVIKTVDFDKMTNFADNENTGQQREHLRSKREKVVRPSTEAGTESDPKTRTPKRNKTTAKGRKGAKKT